MATSSRSASIPSFTLYGEAPRPAVDMLHIEAIQSRSRLHRWEIDAHTHPGLHQILWVASGPAEVVLEGAREACRGPVAIVVPPGVVHAFRFTAETDGRVLTFNPRAVVEGDVPATGEALRALFARPFTRSAVRRAASGRWSRVSSCWWRCITMSTGRCRVMRIGSA
jgi:AraC family transcriptional regulator, transcriptional activator of pobA